MLEKCVLAKYVSLFSLLYLQICEVFDAGDVVVSEAPACTFSLPNKDHVVLPKGTVPFLFHLLHVHMLA